MAKNILIVPSRGQQATKQPYIYFTDTSDDIQEWKVGTGATITLSANTGSSIIEIAQSGFGIKMRCRNSTGSEYNFRRSNFKLGG
jgi:hypothetical protein